MKNEKTILKVVCAWCGADLGTKDGKGTEGVTHGICKKCAKKELAKVPKKPARWNLVGRFLERRRYIARLEREHANLIEFDRQADERENLRQAFEGNQELQTWAVLNGRQGTHWIDVREVAVLEDRVKDQPEFKHRWN